MTTGARYRVEDGRSWIDIRVAQSRQLFDGRDPAPFRERDLDDDAVEYLVAAAEEIPRKQRLAIAVTIWDEPAPRMAADSIVEAVHSHFRHAHEQIQRRLREHLRETDKSGCRANHARCLPGTCGVHAIAPVRSRTRDSSRGIRHHGLGSDVAATRRSPL